MSMKPYSLLLALAFLCPLSWGCSSQDYSLAQVKGRVTKAGEPVVGASVAFQPIAAGESGGSAGPGSYGITNEQGAYALQVMRTKAPGAVVGTHRVIIQLAAPRREEATDGVVPSNDQLSPARFRDGSTQIDVLPEGLESADFNLDAP